jgi:hypothetical protein
LFAPAEEETLQQEAVGPGGQGLLCPLLALVVLALQVLGAQVMQEAALLLVVLVEVLGVVVEEQLLGVLEQHVVEG